MGVPEGSTMDHRDTGAETVADGEKSFKDEVKKAENLEQLFDLIEENNETAIVELSESKIGEKLKELLPDDELAGKGFAELERMLRQRESDRALKVLSLEIDRNSALYDGDRYDRINMEHFRAEVDSIRRKSAEDETMAFLLYLRDSRKNK